MHILSYNLTKRLKRYFWPYFDLMWQDGLWPWTWPLTLRWHLPIGIDSILNWCIWYHTNWLIGQKHDFWPYFDLIWQDDLWPWAWPLTCRWHLPIGIDSMLNWCIWYHTNWLIGQKHDFWPYFDLIWQDDLWPWTWPLTCRWPWPIDIDSMLYQCIWWH